MDFKLISKLAHRLIQPYRVTNRRKFRLKDQGSDETGLRVRSAPLLVVRHPSATPWCVAREACACPGQPRRFPPTCSRNRQERAMTRTTTAHLPQESAEIRRLTQTTQAEILRSVRLDFLFVSLFWASLDDRRFGASWLLSSNPNRHKQPIRSSKLVAGEHCAIHRWNAGHPP